MDCAFCGRDFFQAKTNQKYCSARCRVRRFSSDAPDKIHGKKNCLNCGKEFESRYSKAKFCKPKCHWDFANASRPTTKEVDRECPICKTLFKPMQKRGVGKMCCTDECTKIWRSRYKPNYLDRVAKIKNYLSAMAVYGKADRKRNPEKHLDSYMQRRYGITYEEYNAMFQAQNGVCAICKKPEMAIDGKTKKPRRLAVDHHHEAGQVRKLLCTLCNTGIGSFRENIDLLNAAIEYLKDHIFTDRKAVILSNVGDSK